MLKINLKDQKSTHPFLNCGTDFAGPFMIKVGTLRSSKSVKKMHICGFICFCKQGST